MDTPKYKELQQQFAEQTDEKGRIDTLLSMAVEVRSYDVDESLKLADEIIQRAEAISYTGAIGQALKTKGSCYWLKGEYEDGLAVLKEGMAIANKLKDKRLQARILYYQGNISRDQGDLASVLTHFKKALIIYEELGDEFSQSVILTSISNLLYDLNDYDSALEYALKCLPIFVRAHSTSSLININNTLGNIYFKKEQFPEALHHFRENIGLSEPETLTHVMAESGLGKVYYKMQQFDDAEKYLANSLQSAQHLGNIEVQIICQFYLGRLHMDEGSYRKAATCLNVAYDMATEYNRRHDLMSIHETMSALYDAMGDIPKAFHHLKSFEQLKEEIFKQKIINELRNLQVRQQIELAQKEKEVAERTAHLKHQFMANMSHEIRTPMNAIVGMTRLLLSKDPKPDQLRYLNAIQLSADNLLVIINDILDISKIEAGKIVIESTDFTIREILQSARDMLMLKAEEKQIALNLEVEDAIPNRLVGDPTRLHQILINLAGNAVKFTEKGSVTIKTSIRKKANKIWLQFDVIDTGIGIAPDYVDTIFDSFTQAGSDVTRKFGGTGLGLAISRQLVTLMNGDISVKSELQKGTTFTVVLPFEEATVQESQKTNNLLGADDLQRLNNIRLLLVEDNDFNRMVAEDTLKEMIPSIALDIAVNGADAIKRLETDEYDVVLMDIQMPVMDGVTATQHIRSKLSEPARSVKIIAMTANVLQEDVQQYLEVGMDAYVSKPFNASELLLKMHTVLEGKVIPPHVKKAASAPAAPAVAAAPPEPVLPDKVTDRMFLKQFTGGKPDKMQKYITMFLENAPKLLSAIDNGLAVGDYNAIKIAAHSLKPQLSYMGVREEVSHIFMIEQAAGSSAHQEKLPEQIRSLHKVCQKAFEELREN
jgi:signal transduction histidine kinase/CheY-like chemotaxis protein/HPt (histidine-containing phosphotransfer) domain-containing protein